VKAERLGGDDDREDLCGGGEIKSLPIVNDESCNFLCDTTPKSAQLDQKWNVDG
jgi:hypothetical protein